ncbi:MAG: hypothetical protein V4492_06795 [Chlamydiota bacterium]
MTTTTTDIRPDAYLSAIATRNWRKEWPSDVEALCREVDTANTALWENNARLCRKALKNLFRARLYTVRLGEEYRQIVTVVRKWGYLNPERFVGNEKGVVLGQLFASRFSPTWPITAEKSQSVEIGALVVATLSHLPGRRIAQIVQIAGKGPIVAIGPHGMEQCNWDQVFALEKQFQVIQRELVDHPWRGLGRRSILMYRRLDPWPQFENGGLVFKGSGYALLSRNLDHLSQICVASCGGNYGREIFTFDPNRDLLIHAVYDRLKEKVEALALPTEGEILRLICKWMGQEVFPSREIEKVTRAQHTGDFIYGYRSNGHHFDATLVVSIDRFIEKRVGVCRHHAFVTLYLLDRLCRDQILRGTAFQMRHALPPRRIHSWVVFKSDTGAAWHVDTVQRRIVDFSIQTNCEALIASYSEKVIAPQLAMIRTQM